MRFLIPFSFFNKDNANGSVEELLRNILHQQEALAKAQEAMAKDREAMAKDFKHVKTQVDGLVTLSSERDKNHVNKLDKIIENVDCKFKKSHEFPITNEDALDNLSDRVVHGTEKFKSDLVNIK